MRAEARIRLLVTILDRGRGDRAAELFASYGLPLHYAVPGRGTANSELLDYLGLGETEKDVLLTLAPGYTISALLPEAVERLGLAAPGRGILFTLPMSAVSRTVADYVSTQAHSIGPEREQSMDEQRKDHLIVAVVDGGGTDQVMAAAKEAGARGGTILHGRRVGEGEEKGAESAVHPEKDVIFILTSRSSLPSILEAVDRAAGISTQHRGVLFSLPVEEVRGLPRLG